MARGPRGRSPGLQDLFDRYIGDDPAKVAAFEAAKSNAEVARALYRLRTGAGLTQRALAARVGTTTSVICRLEDAEYEGHSLSMLRRIAAALGRRVEIRFPAAPGAKAAKGTRPLKARTANGGSARAPAAKAATKAPPARLKAATKPPKRRVKSS